ncbi:MAG TPA: IPT/TIG domain-containing protein [Vicinamibacteria bacterium]|nr:IPT/TIG domain-containing protein [Vicinamibacteria bacterium]
MKSATPEVRGVAPLHAVPGGRIAILGSGFDPSRAHEHHVYFGDRRALVCRVSEAQITAVVPEGALPEVHVSISGEPTIPFRVSIASTFANELQPVANPVFDRSGFVYVTLSGSRGEKVPVSVFRISEDGDVEPYADGIVNATGLAWGPDDHLYVSSRHDGIVYRVGMNHVAEPVADELGIATGLAFDGDGILYVGDRRGTVFRVEPNGEPRSFCHLEPSVAAYHLAFDRDGNLLVTAPSLATTDPVYRVSPDGEVSIFSTGFGRPQGIAFDDDGNLYVAEGLIGDSGVYRVAADGSSVEPVIAAPSLVGLAFDNAGGVLLAGDSSLFQLELGVRGLLNPG